MNIKDRVLIQQALNKNSVNHSVIANSSRSVNYDQTSITIDNTRGVVIFQHKDTIVELDLREGLFMGVRVNHINTLVQQLAEFF